MTRALNRRRPSSPPIGVARWLALAAGLVSALPRVTPPDLRTAVAIVVAVALAAWRSWRPVDLTGPAAVRAVTLEAAVVVVGATISGGWVSPLALPAVVVAAMAGFVLGPWLGAGLTAVASAAMSFGTLDELDGADAMRIGFGLGALTVLVALLGAFARRISTESARRQSMALDRLGRLAEANALLFSLHRVAQTLPASLDLDEVLDSSLQQLRDLLLFDSATVLLSEGGEGPSERWVPARRVGNRNQPALTTADLAPVVLRAMATAGVVSAEHLGGPEGPGLAPGSHSGLYAALQARGTLIGLLAIEAAAAEQFTSRDIELLAGMVEPLALAIDNARWFSRLRRVGADEERSRIARDLHDRVGQSLAYVGFELDRAVKASERGDDVSAALVTLRTELRAMQREVRETLYDLRAEVSPDRQAERALQELLERVQARSGVEVGLEVDERQRLSPRLESELFRIAKEAVLNAERHAEAHRIDVRWSTDGMRALLVVADDGKGITPGAARDDSYGITGMRERAEAIGAVIDLVTTPGEGTTVRVVLAPR